MSISRLREALRKATPRYTRSYWLVIAPLMAFLLALWSYGLARLRGDWRYRHDTYRHQRILLNLEELLYRLIIVPLVAFLPAPWAYALARLRGDWRYRYDVSTRGRVIHSLEGVLGNQLSPTERAQVTRDFFHLRSCYSIDVMRLAGKGRALARLVEIRGLEHIEAALAAGKGAVLCCAHFGLFNGAFSLIGACHFPLTVVGNWRSKTDPSMSPLQRLILRFSHEKRVARHRRPNIEPHAERFGAAIRIAQVLRANELIAMPIDVPVYDEDRARAVPVNFLDHRILLLPGCITIAQLTGSPILVLVVRRSADWRHQILEISPPVPLDGDTVTDFKHCVAMVEAPICQNPAHWTLWDSPQDLADLGLLSTEEQH